MATRRPQVVEKNYFRFEVGRTRGTVLAARLDDGSALSHATSDEDWWKVCFECEWTDPADVAFAGVRDLWHKKNNTGLTGHDDLPILNGISLRTQENGLGPGEYYPRIWRPCGTDFHQVDVEGRTDGKTAATRLEQALREYFSFVDPSDVANRKVFGHRTRELLILASAEVENSWREILVANGVNRRRFSTNDYFATRDVLRLRNWKVRLRDYPRYHELQPFAGWSEDAPTKSLGWFDAYNETKHSRQRSFSHASLENAVSAVAGVWCLHGAMYGPVSVNTGSAMFSTDCDTSMFPNHEGYLDRLVDWPTTPVKPMNYPFFQK